jgi:xanthine/uracil/vitamin C permease (AzgA family)
MTEDEVMKSLAAVSRFKLRIIIILLALAYSIVPGFTAYCMLKTIKHKKEEVSPIVDYWRLIFDLIPDE